MSVLSLVVAGLGCKHVGGKCDCQGNPNDGIIVGPTAPYPAGPAITPGAKTPTKMPDMAK